MDPNELQPTLGTLLALYADAKLAHWNVIGPLRVPLHALFEDVADAASEHADSVAERMVHLGGVVGPTAVAPKGTVDRDGLVFCESISGSLDTAIGALVVASEAAEGSGDQATLDLLTGASLELEKLASDVAAHLAS